MSLSTGSRAGSVSSPEPSALAQLREEGGVGAGLGNLGHRVAVMLEVAR